MAHTRKTLSLTSKWDLTLDGVGRIALSNGAAATAQNVANEARLFTNDAYFVQEQGIPHFAAHLKKNVSPALLRSYLHKAAMRVEDVVKVQGIELNGVEQSKTTLSGRMLNQRTLNAHIKFTTKEGENGTVRTNI